MTSEQPAVVILAAGLGTRMQSRLPKVMHRLAGRPLIRHLIASVETLDPERICVVIGEGMDSVAAAVAPLPTAIQYERLGTAHAVLAAESMLADVPGDVLILYGDVPLISPETIRRMIAVKRSTQDTGVVVLGFRPDDPSAYGRMIINQEGDLEAIVEAKDATPDQLQISLCNAGTMLVDGQHLVSLLKQVGNANAKNEYYLTDIIGLARQRGLRCRVAEGNETELVGINTRAELAHAERIVQQLLRQRAMAEGATLIDPNTTYFSFDTRLGRDVTVGPCVVFGPGVTIGDNVEIQAFCHLSEATLADGVTMGPFARLRPGADISSHAHIGNFVEIKNATVEAGAKVNHLSYIGDARIGAKANIGAGTITCNYDGFFKSFTNVGVGAFIGSNTSLVAPVTIGDGAIIGAGSAITQNVQTDALAVRRAPHLEKADWAKKFRQRKQTEKAARDKPKN